MPSFMVSISPDETPPKSLGEGDIPVLPELLAYEGLITPDETSPESEDTPFTPEPLAYKGFLTTLDGPSCTHTLPEVGSLEHIIMKDYIRTNKSEMVRSLSEFTFAGNVFQLEDLK